MFITIKRKISDLLISFRICPVGSLLMVLLAFMVGPLYSIMTKQTGVLIDMVSKNMGTSGKAEIYLILINILIFAIIAFLANMLSQLISANTKNNLEMYITEDMMRTSEKVPYLEFVSSEHFNDIASMLNMLSSNISLGISSLTRICLNVSIFISYSSLLFINTGIIPLILCIIAAIIATIIHVISGRDSMESMLATIKYQRKQRYLDRLFLNSASYGEMSLFGNKPRLQVLYEENLDQFAAKRWPLEKRNLNRNIMLQCITSVITIIVMIIFIIMIDVTSSGQIVMLFAAFFALLASSTEIGENISSIDIYFSTFEQYHEYKVKHTHENVTETRDTSDVKTDCTIALHNVSFAYGDHQIIQNINMNITQGQKIAIVGENGSGKTTLMNIILGLFPCEGKTEIYGMDAYQSRKQGKNPVVSVMQTFGKYESLSLGENIAFDASIAPVIMQLNDFFDEVNLNDIIGDKFGGKNYSGGQWQKIALARCINSNAEIMILDEPTAALDPNAEVRIFNQFMEINSDKTCILVTHRLGAVRNSDCIYVLKDQSIYEQGTHDELMKKNGYYADMFRAQAQWYKEDRK